MSAYIPAAARVEWHNNVAAFEVSASDIVRVACDLYRHPDLSLKMLTASDERKDSGCFKVYYVFGAPKINMFFIPFIRLTNAEEFPSLAPFINEAWNYERRIQTFFGLNPVGHPDGRSLTLHENWPEDLFPLRKDFDWQHRPARAEHAYVFQQVEGEGIYQIPVGPIHAGIIEPGHFRFNVAGEEIILLEPRLGYAHKGSEKLFEHMSLGEQVRLSEKISGDSSFSHSLAFCQAVESLQDAIPPKRALYLRVIYSELERLANHLGDIGAIMLDAGFNFGGAHGARLKEMIMRINERLSGSRFLRGVNAIGGVTKDINGEAGGVALHDLNGIMRDFSDVVDVAEDSTSLLHRLNDTGTLSYEVARDLGVLGVAGKALGVQGDARIDYPYAAYGELDLGEMATAHSGDVYARFTVRIQEARMSYNLIKDALEQMPDEEHVAASVNAVLKKNALAIGIVEGWRGDIVYFVTTDARGAISRVAVRDPSFLNWASLGHAASGNVVLDFPLINKSFNLSYSGNDL